MPMEVETWMALLMKLLWYILLPMESGLILMPINGLFTILFSEMVLLFERYSRRMPDPESAVTLFPEILLPEELER